MDGKKGVFKFTSRMTLETRLSSLRVHNILLSLKYVKIYMANLQSDFVFFCFICLV